MAFLGQCRATGIGSLPHTDARAAVEAVFEFCPDLPHWPQLPKVSPLEGMNEQALEGFPGLRVEGRRLRHVQDDAFFEGVERIFAAHAAGDASVAAMSPEAAHGFAPFLEAVGKRRPREAKGQVAGPVTVGMAVLGEGGNPILYDDVLRDVLEKFLSLRVRWQAEQLRAAGAEPVVFVDEPFLASFGTPFFNWDVERVRATLDAVLAGAGLRPGIAGLRPGGAGDAAAGSHCCSNTDWSIFLGSRLQVVSFDAFEFAENFLVYRDDLAAYLSRGGNIAWGIVPTDPEALAAATADALRARLLGLVKKVEALGFRREQVLRQSLVTPACGLGTRSMDTARHALGLARDVAAALRREYLGATQQDEPKRRGSR